MGYIRKNVKGEFVSSPAEHSVETESPLLSGVRILVVDDSKTIRRSAETLLMRLGADVETAEDGFDALAKVARYRPHLVFVDIMMPRLDGYQTCALIKNNASFKSTPVVMLSSKDSVFDKAKGRVVGASSYVTKPFSRDELVDAVKAHLPSSMARAS
ncbi:MAG: response regulator [Thioalkalivibrionaceae bacterium]